MSSRVPLFLWILVLCQLCLGGGRLQGAETVKVILRLNGNVENCLNALNLRSIRHFPRLRIAVVRVSPENLPALYASPRVSRLENDAVVSVRPTLEGTETQSPATWGLDRIDQRLLPLNDAFSYSYSGAGVDAYVIDTGVRLTHQEFGDRAFHHFSAYGSSADGHGHGTHVAGTIGGLTYGVAKDVRIYAVKVLDDSGFGSYSDIIAGVVSVTNRANTGRLAVANMSLGGPRSDMLDSAVEASIASGVVYGLAAGNGSTDASSSSPAAVSEGLTVGSTTISDEMSSFSNYGSLLDLFAPGSSITSAFSTNDTATATWSGTSMATPHVVGVAALVREAFPGEDPQSIGSRITGDATQGLVTDLGALSANLLLYSTLDGAEQPPPTPADCNNREILFGSSIEPGLTLATVSGSVSGTTAVGHAFEVCTTGTYTFDTCSSGTSYDSWLCLLDVNDQPIASNDDFCSVQSQITAALEPGNYTIAVSGYSASSGNYTLSYSASVSGCGSPPEVPTVVSFTATPSSIFLGELVTLSWVTNAAETVAVDGQTGLSPNGSKLVSPATTTVYTLVANGPGGSASAETTVTVQESQPPPNPEPLLACNGRAVEVVGTVGATSLEEQSVTGYVSPSGSAGYTFEVCESGNFTFTTCEPTLSVTLDSYVCVLDQDGNLIGDNDDACGRTGLQSLITVFLTPGQYVVAVSGYVSASGDYILVTSADVPNCTFPPPPSIDSFIATPDTILADSGESATLIWQTSGADEVAIDGQTGLAPDGQITVSPTETTTYTLLATGPGGPAASADVTVTVLSPPPSIDSFIATPDTILAGSGESATLMWQTSGADEVAIDGQTGLAPDGQITVSPAETRTYTLLATGPGGPAASANVTVTVLSPPPSIEVFVATPDTILAGSGESATLMWQTSWADAVAIDGQTGLAPDGQITVSPAETRTYTLLATGPGGPAAIADVTVTVVSPPPEPEVPLVDEFYTGTAREGRLRRIVVFRATAGLHRGVLTGPEGMDFDLFLERRARRSWEVVASSLGPDSSESIELEITDRSRYRFRVLSNDGRGTYEFIFSHP